MSKLKKLLASLLAVAMLASVGTGVMAEDTANTDFNTTTQSTSTDREVLANLVPTSARASTYTVTENSVRLRATASLSGTILGQLQKGDIVESAGHIRTDADGYTWEYVYSRRHKCNGWVAVNYLSE